ncbi:MAG: hypothetical protein ACRCZF_08625, partial [Gemmataceae bacterium]
PPFPGAKNSVDIRINDDPAYVCFHQGLTEQEEGDTDSILLERRGGDMNQALTVPIAIGTNSVPDPLALWDLDYTVEAAPTSPGSVALDKTGGTVTFGAGVSQIVLQLKAKRDNLVEAPFEGYRLSILPNPPVYIVGPSGGLSGFSETNVRIEDDPVHITVTPPDQTVPEGSQCLITINRSGGNPDEPLTVGIGIVDNNQGDPRALNPDDYTLESDTPGLTASLFNDGGTVTFDAGTTLGHLTVDAMIDSNSNEGTEGFRLDALPDSEHYLLGSPPSSGSGGTSVPTDYRANVRIVENRPIIKIITAPKFVLVNADNDNGSGWVAKTSQTIPVIRDFMVTDKTVANEDDLKRIKIEVTHNMPGILTVTARPTTTKAATGKAKLWKRGNKELGTYEFTELLPGPTASVVELYIEGIDNSYRVGDVAIDAEFHFGDDLQAIVVTSKVLTVGPVVTKYDSTTYGAQVWDRPLAQQKGIVTGKTGENGGRGDTKKGIEFDSTVLYGGLPGSAKYVQTVNKVDVVAGGHVVMSDGDRLKLAIMPDLIEAGVTFPLNDNPGGKNPPAAVPYYLTNTPFDNGSQVQITTHDTPGFLAPLNKPETNTLRSIVTWDMMLHFTTHVVWKYADGSLYSLAYADWDAELAGNSQKGKFANTGKGARIARVEQHKHDNPKKLEGPAGNDAVQLK